MNFILLLRAASIKVKNCSLFVRPKGMAHIMSNFVLSCTVPCKIIGCANGCCEGKYVETQTNQNSRA